MLVLRHISPLSCTRRQGEACRAGRLIQHHEDRMKPIVRYRGPAVELGGRAWFESTVDHPNPFATQQAPNSKRPVRTSRVLDWDKVSGRIETENTIYVPEA